MNQQLSSAVFLLSVENGLLSHFTPFLSLVTLRGHFRSPAMSPGLHWVLSPPLRCVAAVELKRRSGCFECKNVSSPSLCATRGALAPLVRTLPRWGWRRSAAPRYRGSEPPSLASHTPQHLFYRKVNEGERDPVSHPHPKSPPLHHPSMNASVRVSPHHDFAVPVLSVPPPVDGNALFSSPSVELARLPKPPYTEVFVLRLIRSAPQKMCSPPGSRGQCSRMTEASKLWICLL